MTGPAPVPTATELVEQLRRAGSVFAEDEFEALAKVWWGADLVRAVRRRCDGEFVEHLVGQAAFAGLDLHIAAPVFVPRPRAMALLRVAAAVLRHPGTTGVHSTSDTETDTDTGTGSDTCEAPLVVDLGCGCGALAASLASITCGGERRPRILAVDSDPAAVACAAVNGSRYGFQAWRGDWLHHLPAPWTSRLQLVVAYLPHMPDDELERRPRDLARAETLLSVAGGHDGLDPLRAVLPQLPDLLAPAGAFVTLLHERQQEAALAAVEAAGLHARWAGGDAPGDVVLIAGSGRRQG
ncbi:MAG: hypothetical protein ACTHMZ_12050 [Actinomycetes bacterium]